LISGDYAVIINTKNTKVQKQFDIMFTEAATNIDTGWYYSVEVTGKIRTYLNIPKSFITII